MSDADRDSDAGDDPDADEPLAVWCAGEEWCAVTATATILGKKWHPVVIHRLLDGGPMGFNELKHDVDGISSKVLSDSLEDLGEKALVNREIVNEKPVRVEYSLTDRGASLRPVIESMAAWGERHLAAAEDADGGVS
ncbi:helix-turn-helix transcriptional regulator [Halorussus salilacus]|uniref:winged helix-turn-helix transcriptional regulator n=1 Tax=Halorussus salilacus TaxID=2953750 RepID=UPI0020A165A0|nr:helix-turn-helix domain-containing protein [Halorussus salilacus]USZ69293.1 helix-turn-helix transcriptional regulator [Halorussus salilacus]